MSIRSEFLIGATLLILGILWLGGNILGVDVWTLCIPAGLILLGTWLLVRPRILKDSGGFQFRIFGDIHRSGNWTLENEEIWIGIGDVDLNLTQAHIPAGETTVRVIRFIGDVDLLAPPDVGISIASYSFLTSSKIMKRKRDSFVIPFEYQSEGYPSAERKLHLAVFGFINEIKVRQITIN
jgi:lia operon protein LiaF